jgi:hypothetical protein
MSTLDHFLVQPADGDMLDATASLFSIVRGVNETDSQLRARINNMMRHQPGPHSSTLQLFLFLEKLGIRSTSSLLDAFLPIGISRR